MNRTLFSSKRIQSLFIATDEIDEVRIEAYAKSTR